MLLRNLWDTLLGMHVERQIFIQYRIFALHSYKQITLWLPEIERL